MPRCVTRRREPEEPPLTTIAQARAQLAEHGSRSLPEPELRQFLAIGAAVRAARTTEELVAALLHRASTGGQAECLAARSTPTRAATGAC